MAISEVGFVDNSVQLAHYAMLARIKALAPAHGWTILRDLSIIVRTIRVLAHDRAF